MATVDVLKLGLALPLGYLAAKLAPGDPASATTAATVAASLIGGAAGNFAHQALDAPTSALFARVFKAGTGLDENHTILLALRGAHLDALAEVAERAAKRLGGGDRDAGFLSYRAGLDGYLGAARQKLTPAGFAMPSDAERAVFDGLPEAFSAGLAERDANAADADARDMRASVEAAVLTELRADLGEDAPASFAAAFAGSDAPGDDGWFGAFVRAASARLKDNGAFATIWTASRVARIEAALTRHGTQLHDIAERMATENEAERRHREVLAKQDEILASVSREKGVDPEHLRPILERLGHQNVSVVVMPRVLAGAVDQLQAMARERNAPSNDGGDINAAIARARVLLAGADAAGAVKELDRALDADEAFQAAVKRRVRLLTEKVEIQRTTYDHDGALATLTEIVRLDPNQTWAHGAQGDICATVGRLGRAKAHFETAYEAAERLSDFANLAVGHDRIGDCLRAAGDRDGALAAYQAGLAIAETLAESDPGNTRWQRDLSVSYNKVGDCLRDAGDRDGALAAYYADLAIAKALSARDPSNAQWQRDLSISHERIGDCLRDAGDRVGASAAYRTALAIRQLLVGRDPDNSLWQRDLSVSHNKIGDCLRDAGDRDGALSNYGTSLAIRKVLAERDPHNTLWRRDLSVSYNKIGDCLRDAGDSNGALTAYQASLTIRQILAECDPGSTFWQRDLSISNNNIGDCMRDAGDRDGAIVAYRAGLAIAEALAARDPGNAEWQRDLIVSNVRLAATSPRNANACLSAAIEVARRLSATGRLAPVDDWILDDLEKAVVDAQAASPLTPPSQPSDNP
jgi:tetratricopeptide (TPR) repeat protein